MELNLDMNVELPESFMIQKLIQSTQVDLQ